MPFESDFEREENEAAPAPGAFGAVPEFAEQPEEEEDTFDTFLAGVTEPGTAFDPTSVIHLVSTSGGSRDVPVTGSMTIAQAMTEAGFTTGQNVEYWFNQARVDSNFEVAGGAEVTIVGVVKGGGHVL